MKVVVDDKIPYIQSAIEDIADEVVYLPGSAFTPEAVKDADALIIRTRTRCDRNLLGESSVRFIATATIGFDHIDIPFCREAGIEWQNAPGCNAASVQQYLKSVLLLLKSERGLALEQATIGIIGVGHVGTKVAEAAEALGMRVLLYDTPRADKEGPSHFATLEQVMEESDVITFHVPLYKEGKYKTFHFADERFFSRLKRRPVIVNTSRGPVIETAALLDALREGQVSDAVIDVWENEPGISMELLHKVFIGTPHIAGYSADGKANATRMSLHSLCRFFGIRKDFEIVPPQPEDADITASSYDEAVLKIYDPRNDCRRLLANPEKFEWLRGNYPLRREEGAYRIHLS